MNQKHELIKALKDKMKVMGPCQTAYEKSSSELGRNKEHYFGGDAMTGNRLHIGYKNALEGKFDLLKGFENYPEEHKKLKKLWTNVAKIDVFFSNESPTPEETEEGAKECEKVCIIFPVLGNSSN